MSINWAAKMPDNSTARHYNFEKPSGGSASHGRGIYVIFPTGRKPIRNAEPSLTREGLRDVCKLSRQGQLCTSRQ